MSKKISELPLYVGSASPTGDVAISINGVTYRIDPNLLVEYTPTAILPTEFVLIENDFTEIIVALNLENKSGFINFLITDQFENARAGNVNFLFNSVSQKFSETVLQSIGNTSIYTFDLTNDFTTTKLRVYNDSSNEAKIKFFKQLI